MNILYPSGRYPYAAAAVYSPGDIVTRPDGSLALFDGLQACAVGDQISPEPLHAKKVAEVAVKATNSWSAGDSVYRDGTTNEATSVSTDNTLLGKATHAVTSGDPTAILVLE